MSRIIIIHGEKSKPNGWLHPAFKERLDKALKISKKANFDLLIITGGKTRKISPPESQAGYDYLKNKTRIPFLLEKESRTTIENIKFTKKLLAGNKIDADKLIVITSRKRIFRIKFLYHRLWPETYKKIEFIPAKDFYPPIFYLYEFLSLIIDAMDIKETFLGLSKKFFRNG